MTKPRYTPVLSKYGASTARGLCSNCCEPLDVLSKWIVINGVEHRVHHECWKAILVAVRLTGAPKQNAATATVLSSSSVYEVFDDSDVEKIRTYLAQKIRDRFLSDRQAP